jgi:YD repeat-containing protein
MFSTEISHPLNLETLLMQPHNPARRRLLGGIVAGLFGWLASGKSEARPPQPQSAPTSTTQETTWGTTSSYVYDGQGKLVAYSGDIPHQFVTRLTYDAETGRTTITDH